MHIKHTSSEPRSSKILQIRRRMSLSLWSVARGLSPYSMLMPLMIVWRAQERSSSVFWGAGEKGICCGAPLQVFPLCNGAISTKNFDRSFAISSNILRQWRWLALSWRFDDAAKLNDVTGNISWRCHANRSAPSREKLYQLRKEVRCLFLTKCEVFVFVRTCQKSDERGEKEKKRKGDGEW